MIYVIEHVQLRVLVLRLYRSAKREVRIIRWRNLVGAP